MVKYPDVSLVLQGPITEKWAEQAGKHIEYYQSLFGEVIISTWNNSKPMVELMNIYYDPNIKVVCTADDIDPCLDVQYNMGKQALTTLKGLRACTKPYVLKHRTDEYYSNLDVLVDKFYQSGHNKWICAPVCFLPASQYPFHAADHLFIAPRDRLIRTFSKAIGRLYCNSIERNNNNEPAAEITFTIEYMFSRPILTNPERYEDGMLNDFDIVPLESLMPFSITIGTKGHNFTTPEDVYQDMPFLRNATIESLVTG